MNKADLIHHLKIEARCHIDDAQVVQWLQEAIKFLQDHECILIEREPKFVGLDGPSL